MILLWIYTHCWLYHIRCFCINMMPIWHACIFICFTYAIWFFTRSSVLRILALIFEFLKYWSRHDSNEECINFKNIKHLQPHMTLYCADIFFSWGGNSERNVKSLIMILFSAFIASLSPPYTESPTRMLWSSQMDTCSYFFGTICDLVWP